MLKKMCMAGVLCAGLSALTVEPVHSQQDTPLTEFTERIESYVKLHKKALETAPLPKTSEDPAEILKAQEKLAGEIRKARADAKQGNIFTPGVQPLFMNLIRAKLGGKEGEAARATVLGEGNPKSPESASNVPLKVNASYPSTAPMSTVPPSLLVTLPTLPEELEFRFVGRHLILRDVQANLIVDFLTNAVPGK